MSSKYSYESDLIGKAFEELNNNGRTVNFIKLEDQILNNGYFKDICEFAYRCKNGLDVKKLEKSLTSKMGEQYPNGFFFLAKHIKGTNHKLLEKLFIDFANNFKVVTEDIVNSATDFAVNFKDSDANNLFKIVLKSNLWPAEKCLKAIKFAEKTNIDISLLKEFAVWCKKQEKHKDLDNAIAKLSNKIKELQDINLDNKNLI